MSILNSFPIFLIFILIIFSSFQSFHSIFPKVSQLFKDETLNDTLLSQIMVSGSVNGYFTHDEFFNLTTYLSHSFPQYVSLPVTIGKTYLEKPIKAIQLGELSFVIRKQG